MKEREGKKECERRLRDEREREGKKECEQVSRGTARQCFRVFGEPAAGIPQCLRNRTYVCSLFFLPSFIPSPPLRPPFFPLSL